VKIRWYFLGLAGVALVAGCTDNDEPKETPALREALTKPPKFDLDKVPPEHREMVRAMTSGQGANPSNQGSKDEAKK
jgi:hypothetical protein